MLVRQCLFVFNKRKNGSTFVVLNYMTFGQVYGRSKIKTFPGHLLLLI